ncbi:FxsC protein [Streptomyces justiciae]|uniref:FxsC protein n=1 Tax=Streptomyces justiciae TaxID=2780140 RepID=A0ABU3LTM8_9ACTN|nr:FxsC protein [Streptomyces justiciae]MDT7841908.1 FxsC protein [Streptomyces justiciae]
MHTPWFFVSYAPTPPSVGETDDGRPEADKSVREFYEDLLGEVRELSGTLAPRSVGHLDAADRGGARSVRALHDCHVFVPVITRRYFTDVYCGRQWHALTHRARRGTLVPALWTPVPTTARPVPVDLTLPVPAPPTEPVPVDGEALKDYAKGGLYGLRADTEHPEYYDQCVRRIAQRVVQAVRRAPEPRPDSVEFTDLDDIPDAFAASSWHPLGIAVLAPDMNHLPPGRRDTKYGRGPRDWQPYSDGYGTPLAERTAELARNLGFAPEIRTYDQAEPVFLGHRETRSPWVLILDPWILRDPTALERVRAFDSCDLPWVSVLTPIADDPQTRQAADDLDRLLRAALPRRLSSSRPIQRGAMLGIDNSETFNARFMELADSAAQQYLNRVPLRSTTTRPSASAERPHAGDQEDRP